MPIRHAIGARDPSAADPELCSDQAVRGREQPGVRSQGEGRQPDQSLLARGGGRGGEGEGRAMGREEDGVAPSRAEGKVKTPIS